MFNITPPAWALPERLVTPEQIVLNRRKLLVGAGAGAIAAATGPAFAAPGDAWPQKFSANETYKDAGRAVTPEEINTKYNNFYEFGSHKEIHDAAQALVTDPWTIEVDGLVEKPFKIDIQELISKMQVEERVYRHRCVEAWSMVVPWLGFTLAEFVRFANPLSSAKYVEFKTFHAPRMARGQRQHWYPWPYTEGVTMAEATNDLPLMVVGAYGKELHKQFGAPLRLHLPWKYGFKSIKSIDRITFTEKRPVGFWEELQEREYGFWANVNPAVSHPRWSQAEERVLGGTGKIPTQIFNGYGEQVAHLYKDVEEGDRLWR